jgi:hypothetical protein
LLPAHATELDQIFAQRLANGLRRPACSIAELLRGGCTRTAAIWLLNGILPAAGAGRQCEADGRRGWGQTDGDQVREQCQHGAATWAGDLTGVRRAERHGTGDSASSGKYLAIAAGGVCPKSWDDRKMSV